MSGQTDAPLPTPETIAAGMSGAMTSDPLGRMTALLPSPMVQNHAAFLSRGADGRLDCLWFGGSLEGKADICIYRSTLAAGARVWGPAEQMTDDPVRSEQNPVQFHAPDGRTLLFHTAQPGGDQDRCVVRMREIGQPPTDLPPTDLPPTDLPPVDLPLPLGSFVRGAVHVRGDGAWLLPLFHCTHAPGARWTGRHDTASVAISADQGQTWRLVAVPGSTGCVHMTIVGLGAGRLAAFFRRRQADVVHRTDSADGGESWSVPQPTDVPNNNSSIGVIRLADGRLAMVCNPMNAALSPDRRLSLYDELGDDTRPEAQGGCTPIWGVPRAPLVLALSSDEGRSFLHRILLQDGPGTCLSNNSLDGKNFEMSYPVLNEAPDGGLDIAYTLHRRAIKHLHLPADHLKAPP